MRVAVVGVGLIGGSIGLAARQRLEARVTGYDHDPGVLAQAAEKGAIDAAGADVAEAVIGAELAFVAVPVGALPATVEQVLAAAPADCAVTDVGSTKRPVRAAALDERFIGGHPLAGAETSGVMNARADLFEGATWTRCSRWRTWSRSGRGTCRTTHCCPRSVAPGAPRC